MEVVQLPDHRGSPAAQVLRGVDVGQQEIQCSGVATSIGHYAQNSSLKNPLLILNFVRKYFSYLLLQIFLKHLTWFSMDTTSLFFMGLNFYGLHTIKLNYIIIMTSRTGVSLSQEQTQLAFRGTQPNWSKTLGAEEGWRAAPWGGQGH